MNRRQFLAALGAGSAFAVTGGLPLPDAEPAASVWPGESLHAGDMFTIAGHYAMNPVTGRTTSHLQYFLITDTVSSGDMDEVRIHPAIDGRATVRASVIERVAV